MPGHRMGALVSFLGLIGLSICSPLPLNSYSPLSTAALRERQEVFQCAIEGNSDFYGLGIRIAIYIQWITALVANWYSEAAIGSNLETNTIFLFAVFIAIVVSTVQEDVQSAEVIVLLQLSFGFMFTILSIWGHRTRSRQGDPIRFPLLGSFFRLALATAVSAYSVWFWFIGLDDHGGNANCPEVTFIFVKVDARGTMRAFFQVQAALTMIVYGYLFVRESLMVFCFSVFTICWTAVLTGVLVWFNANSSAPTPRSGRQEVVKDTAGVSERSKPERTGRWFERFKWFLKRWRQLQTSLIWKMLNGKESSGPHRPRLDWYLVPLLNFWLFAFRVLFQFLCLVFFDWCPPMDMPPLISHPALKEHKSSRLSRAINETKATTLRNWLELNTRFKAFLRVEGKQTKDLFASKRHRYSLTSNTLCTSNLLYIAFSVVAVELTLVWNQIEGVNTMDSVGQLIPLIIAIVSFFRLLYGLSVDISAVRSTELIIQTLDVHIPTHNLAGPQQTGEWAQTVAPGGQTNSLSEGNHSTRFWARCPSRRHSIHAIELADILRDEPDFGQERDCTPRRNWERYVEMRHDEHQLRLFYGNDAIEKYHLKDGRTLNIVKRLQKQHPAGTTPDNASEVSGSSYYYTNYTTSGSFVSSPSLPNPARTQPHHEAPAPQSHHSCAALPSCITNRESQIDVPREPSETPDSHRVSAGDKRPQTSSSHGEGCVPSDMEHRKPSVTPDNDRVVVSSDAHEGIRSRPNQHTRTLISSRASIRSHPESSIESDWLASTNGSNANASVRRASTQKKKGAWLAKLLSKILKALLVTLSLLVFPPGGIILFFVTVWPVRSKKKLNLLRKELWKHYKPKKSPGIKDKRAKENKKTPSNEPAQTLPHLWEGEGVPLNLAAVIVIFGFGSAYSALFALANMAEGFFLESHLPVLAEMVGSLSKFVQGAVDIRKRKQQTDMSADRQHKELADLWNELISPDLVDRVVQEGKKGGYKKWDLAGMNKDPRTVHSLDI